MKKQELADALLQFHEKAQLEGRGCLLDGPSSTSKVLWQGVRLFGNFNVCWDMLLGLEMIWTGWITAFCGIAMENPSSPSPRKMQVPPSLCRSSVASS